MSEPQLISIVHHRDERGSLIKPYAASDFARLLPGLEFKEIFFSSNRKDVLRGFHFQKPPMDHSKVVFVLHGKILDVLIDLRTKSPRFGQTSTFELSSDGSQALFVPRGFGHAFLALEDNSTVGYLQETERSVAHESGIAWDSVDFEWPATQPILSDRDRDLMPFREFDSPWK